MNISKLKNEIPDIVLEQIPNIILKFDLSTPLRLSHFLGQCSHESGNFKIVEENLNYSSKGLSTVFKRFFINESEINLYAKNSQNISNKVYGNRMGNGNELSGDGWKYRGRGYIQLTGKDNYKLLDQFVPENLIDNPDLVATKYPLMSAAWFFNKNGLHKLADKGDNDSVVVLITKKINVKLLGLDERILNFKKFYSLLK